MLVKNGEYFIFFSFFLLYNIYIQSMRIANKHTHVFLLFFSPKIFIIFTRIFSYYYSISIFIWGQSWSRGTKCACKSTGCEFDPHSRRWNIYLNLYFHFFALVSRQSAASSSATQHAMLSEIDVKWGTECLNTRFPLPTQLCAGYSMKLQIIREFI